MKQSSTIFIIIIIGILLIAGGVLLWQKDTKPDGITPTPPTSIEPIEPTEPTPPQEPITSPNDGIQKEFPQRVKEVYSFEDSLKSIKKVVILKRNRVEDEITFGDEIYLTNESLDFSKAIKITDTYATNIVNIEISHNNTGKKIFAVELGETSILLANEEGEIISPNIISKNAERMGLGTVVRGQWWVESASFLFKEDPILAITFANGYGEKYTVNINGGTGEYIEGSRKKVQ